MAERVARDQRSVSEYELGKRRIYAHDLPRFAHALQVPISYFFPETGPADDLDEAFLAELHRLDPTERRKLLDIVRLMTQMLHGDR
ncbi:MAG: helix-turn-helix domain-containing protein [Anaerolineae bacterium]|nr:helix-turn-helix domain-containing protein [Anaerolineae bacterium]